MKGKLLTLLVISLMVFDGLFGLVSLLPVVGSETKADQGNIMDKQEDAEESSRGYTHHTPIYIDGNADFAYQAAIEGWVGDGSEGSPYVIEGYEIDGENNGSCININNTDVHFVIRHCFLYNCSRSGNEAGLKLYYIQNGIIDNNNCSDNDNVGIRLKESSNNTIRNNTCSENDAGIWARNSDENTIFNNNCFNNDWHSISLFYSNNCIIENNSCSKNDNGIWLDSSNNNLIMNNICVSNFGEGIHLQGSYNNTIINNICKYNDDSGLYVGGSSSKNTVANNTCSYNNWGIYLYNRVNNNTILNNTCSNNIWYGIIVDESYYNNISNNKMYECGLMIVGDMLSHWNTHTIDSINTINDKPLYYWKNATEGVIPIGAGEVILANCSSVEVSAQNISNSSIGILLGFSSECILMNNTCQYNLVHGIFHYRSSNNTIENNLCMNNGKNGIDLSGFSENNIIAHNNCSNNDWYGIKTFSNNNILENNICSFNEQGICQWGDNNTIANNVCTCNWRYAIMLSHSQKNNIIGNTLSNNGQGIYLRYTSNSNVIQNNILYLNKEYGINIKNNYPSTGNVIHHNNFIDNNVGDVQANDEDMDNYWNDTFGEGNYWSDYEGRYVPPAINNRHIWDIPYDISGDAKSRDFFPLVDLIEINIPIAYAGDNIVIDQHENVVFNSTGSIYLEYAVNYIWYLTYNHNTQILYGPSPNFTFDIAGEYLVTLTISNSLGQGTNDTFNVTVIDITPPIAHAGPDVNIDQHQIATFNASSSSDNVGIVHYNWSFKYDRTEKNLFGEKVSFTFHTVGTYIVILNIIDVEGNWDTDTINVTVNDITPPRADAGPDITINQSETVEFFFHQESLDNVACWNWSWSFKYNGTTQMLFHSIPMSSFPSFIFDMPGNYYVTMTVYDSAGNWAIDILNITVLGLSLPKNLDSDNDTYNDTFELKQGSDPFNSLSTPYDLDADGWNNSVEIQVGSDPMDMLSVPPDLDLDGIPDSIDPDRDGDNVANVDDPYPDDGNRWESESEDEESETTIYVWIGILILVSIIAVAAFILYPFKKRNEDEVEQSSEDELGRVKKSDESDGE